MTSSIRLFWQRLEGSVHPDDAPIFARIPHSFNLDYPPPAFVGDVDNAPVVILMANGGYVADATPREFPRPEDHREFIDNLRGDRKDLPRNLGTYYTRNWIYHWLRNGTAVIVNAVAYRSPKIGNEPENRKLAELLPSVRVHRKWLIDEVLIAARANRRFVIVHRPPMWKLDRNRTPPFSNLLYSPNPVSPYLADAVRESTEKWLRGR